MQPPPKNIKILSFWRKRTVRDEICPLSARRGRQHLPAGLYPSRPSCGCRHTDTHNQPAGWKYSQFLQILWPSTVVVSNWYKSSPAPTGITRTTQKSTRLSWEIFFSRFSIRPLRHYTFRNLTLYLLISSQTVKEIYKSVDFNSVGWLVEEENPRVDRNRIEKINKNWVGYCARNAR